MKKLLKGVLALLIAIGIITGIAGCQPNALPTQCTNNTQDNGETGVDCGGPCPTCPPPQYPDSFYFSFKIDGVQKYYGYNWFGFNSNNVHDGGGNSLEFYNSTYPHLYSAGPYAANNSGIPYIGLRNIAYSTMPNNLGFLVDSSYVDFLAASNSFGNYDTANPVKGLEIYYGPDFTSRYRTSRGSQVGSNITITSISPMYPADSRCPDDPYYIITGTVNCKLYQSSPPNINGTSTLTDGHFRLLNTF